MDMSETFKAMAADFMGDEEGAQIVEYALVIALVSIFVAGLLVTAFTNTNPFTALVGRINTCLTGPTCT